jgi:hypothetical protein
MEELVNKLLEISQELGLATMSNKIDVDLAKLLNKKTSEAISIINETTSPPKESSTS